MSHISEKNMAEKFWLVSAIQQVNSDVRSNSHGTQHKIAQGANLGNLQVWGLKLQKREVELPALMHQLVQVRMLFVQRSRLVYNEGQIVSREVKLKLLGRGRVGLKQIPTY